MTDNEPNDPPLELECLVASRARRRLRQQQGGRANSPTPIAARKATSAKALAMHPGTLDVAYGTGERTKFDLYPAEDRSAPCRPRADVPPDQVLSVLDQRSVISFWQQPPTARNSQRRPPTEVPNDGAGLRLLGPETLDPNTDELPALPRMRREPAPRRYPPFNS
jgi:hypothetical protein